jgi:hypothetical protein
MERYDFASRPSPHRRQPCEAQYSREQKQSKRRLRHGDHACIRRSCVVRKTPRWVVPCVSRREDGELVILSARQRRRQEIGRGQVCV